MIEFSLLALQLIFYSVLTVILVCVVKLQDMQMAILIFLFIANVLRWYVKKYKGDLIN